MGQEKFTFAYLKSQFEQVLENGYSILKCEDYIQWTKKNANEKIIVNRVDIDFSVKKAERLCRIFDELNIKATFFVRLHAPEYNPFSFENYRIIKFILNSGHEIGYHSEVIDESSIWSENAEQCLLRDISVINSMFDIRIKGVASHGGITGLNNLDFWKNKKPSDFGLIYEAYDEEEFNLFNHSFYVSDSEWIRWKCYDKGKKVEGDFRSLAEHSLNKHPVIYSLIHSDTYFDKHFYE